MPSKIILSKGVVAQRTANFTGKVWAELLYGSEEANVINITFILYSRTH